MEIFKLSDGPWKKLFEGAFEENEVNIYSNPKSIILVLIFEKESGKTSGVVVEMFKVFFSVLYVTDSLNAKPNLSFSKLNSIRCPRNIVNPSGS